MEGETYTDDLDGSDGYLARNCLFQECMIALILEPFFFLKDILKEKVYNETVHQKLLFVNRVKFFISSVND